MPYIGRSLGDGVRARYIYAATSGQTTFSGNDSNGIALAYSDTLYMDVYQNGVLLKPVTDYASTTGTSVVLVTGASTDDVLEMIVYDSFAVADTVSAANGGTFSGTVSMSDDLTVATNKLFVDASTDLIGMGTTSPATATGGGIDIHRGGGSSVRIDDTTNSVTGELQVYSAGLNLATVTDHPLLLSTNNTTAMNITADGEVTMPSQPSFLAYGSWSYDSSYYWKGFSTVDHNIGSHWNNTTGTWTCPIAGRYLVYATIYHDSTNNYHLWTFYKNGSSFAPWIQDHNQTTSGENTTSSSAIINCAANDTLRFASHSSYANGYTGAYSNKVGVCLIH